MKFLDWIIVVAYLVYVIWDGIRMTKHSGSRRIFSRRPQSAVVGGRAFGDGDADVGDNFGRHDRTGVYGRNAFYPVLLRFAVGDDNFVRDGRAVFSPRQSLYGLRISGKTF